MCRKRFDQEKDVSRASAVVLRYCPICILRGGTGRDIAGIMCSLRAARDAIGRARRKNLVAMFNSGLYEFYLRN